MISIEELSSKINNDSNAIIEYIIKSFVNANSELSIKDELIKEKEQELINHKNMIEQLRLQQIKSLQSIEDLVLDLKELRKNYGALQQNSKSDEMVIIYDPSEILEYPEEIINLYINKVDLQYLAVEQIFNVINQLIEKGYNSALDIMLKKTIDTKLTALSKVQFNDLIKLLEKYIDSELKANRYPVEVIYYFIKKINSFRWTELLQDFIVANKDNVENIIFYSQRNEQRDKLILEILKTYFLLKQFEFTRKFIEDILNNNLITVFESLSDKDLMEMLFIATYLENDLLVFDYILKHAGGIDHVNWPERDCYITYYDVIEKRENINLYINKFKMYNYICKNINVDIKGMVISKMIITLENINKEKQQEQNRLNSQIVINKDTAERNTVIKNKDINKNLSYEKEQKLSNPTKQMIINKDTVEKVTIIKNKDTTCPSDKYPLIFKECNLMYFDDNKNKKRKLEGTISIKLLYCEKCGWYCANHIILDEISKQVSLKKIIHKPYSTIDTIKRYREFENKEKSNSSHLNTVLEFENKVKNINNMDFKMNDSNLNPQSALGKLGYSTSLTKEERWQLLINKAIPILGIHKTKSFIKWLINIKQADTTKDNSRAIGEWEYDLNRLNKKYG